MGIDHLLDDARPEASSLVACRVARVKHVIAFVNGNTWSVIPYVEGVVQFADGSDQIGQYLVDGSGQVRWGQYYLALAAASDGEVRFEATVGGAIPVIATIEGMDPSHVTAARGVLNGTANFVLSRMAAEGLGYEHVLAEAQDLGVAEADPTFDVDGTDAALKCAILANVLHGGGYSLADVAVQGITDVPSSALDLAAEDGRTVRLIGEVTADGDVRVGPRLVTANDTLAVSGTQNIVQLETTNAGRLNISGRGAGGPETASAVLADVGRLPER